MHATTPRLYSPNIISTWSIRNYANIERRLALPRHVSHGNTIIVFFKFFCTNLQTINETWALLSTELSISKIYKVPTLFFNTLSDDQTDYQFPICNTKLLKNGKLRKAILSAFYNISQRNFEISKLFVQAYLDQNFTHKGKGLLTTGFLKTHVVKQASFLRDYDVRTEWRKIMASIFTNNKCSSRSCSQIYSSLSHCTTILFWFLTSLAAHELRLRNYT
jgi:hypothetical protein